MNCHDATRLISAERDSALGPVERGELEAHIAHCPACQAWRASLAETMAVYRGQVASLPAEQIEAECRAIEARLGTARPAARRPLATVTWIGLPLAAAAAMAVVWLAGVRPFAGPPQYASVDFVEVADKTASPMVYLDTESGVLVVWAVSDQADDPPAVPTHT